MYLALPETPRVEHRDISYSRRPAHEAEVNLWREPDAKPTFSFNLRPRLIQEGIGCKLICCVNGKPQPKVRHLTYLDLLHLLICVSLIYRSNGSKIAHN